MTKSQRLFAAILHTFKKYLDLRMKVIYYIKHNGNNQKIMVKWILFKGISKFLWINKNVKIASY